MREFESPRLRRSSIHPCLAFVGEFTVFWRGEKLLCCGQKSKLERPGERPKRMILTNIIDLYSLIVFIAVILSWVQLPYDNPVVQFVNRLTEPLLQPIRRALPSMGGLDFSPMILLVGLQILKGLLSGAL